MRRWLGVVPGHRCPGVLVDSRAMASCAVFNIPGGPSSSGKPCPRFTAPILAASSDISAKTVVAYGRSRDTVMVLQRRALGLALANGTPRREIGWNLGLALRRKGPTPPNQQVDRRLC
ncbi:hypothetical protein I553_4523 [Mycobacterium xenopi 4042]|uniref:Uncharacterized protein n=1 Tax=Mycobacterium xenopi 4042 TaxID=1299334 RepID=X8AGJ4_MYCXE|nr:hypothetical protein I553_4523 [Mycobacterium xenopi 4042]